MEIIEVVKRDGTKVKFEKDRITKAVYKAMLSVNHGTVKDAENVSDAVVKRLAESGEIPHVEKIQDYVEEELMRYSDGKKLFTDVARSYILYRENRTIIREEKRRLGISDDLKLSLNAATVLESRYLLKDMDGKIIETPRRLFKRVADSIGIVEGVYDFFTYLEANLQKEREISTLPRLDQFQRRSMRVAFKSIFGRDATDSDMKELEEFLTTHKNSASFYSERFLQMMTSMDFMPNSPTLMNAGTDLGQLSACFVIPVGDDIDSIFDSLKLTAKIHKSGGGTGFSFSSLRPRDDIVGSSKGVASGPVSFMKIFDVTTEVIKQGGKRRGANMGILRYDHPDIMEFINSKDTENQKLRNFNISVGMDSGFFERLDRDENVDLINPRTGKVEKQVKASLIWNSIISQAWKTADPGLIFLDEINRHNTVPNVGKIESTNPCGEQPLLPYESCNLGSINLSKFVLDGKIDFARMERIIRDAVRFLDDVIDANLFPDQHIYDMTHRTRKIGLGLMGFADMLAELRIPYDSKEALGIAEEVMSFLQDISHDESSRLASERGCFPAWKGSKWEAAGIKMRNSTTTTIAPTGTISIIADCSSSIEPYFALSFVRHVLSGKTLVEKNRYLEAELKKRGLYSEALMIQIAETGNLEHTDLPQDIKRIFRTAHEISPDWHIMMQATFQRYCDSGVSKTINLHAEATPEDIEKAYRMAFDLKCKGITVYRDRSKSEQVLYSGEKEKKPAVEEVREPKLIVLEGSFDPACPDGKCDL
ncbi:MAG: adenosylcobalamin-dependent ribonucleoside-diphosphate reductase [Candidatus Thermoplasmatota archaeon]|nr:adenosylcobalamin-dependent ribonucleoside-diphosphate reductase [Candidatus Thermoplasmatota archaeon]